MRNDALLDRLAPSRATVLVCGGTVLARGAIARALHDRSPRRNEPFLAIDCARAMRDDLERHLGGPVSQGVVRSAGAGTLYFEAIDAMPLFLQPRFLGYLDDAGRPRVVVATSVDLASAAREGRFRSDLAERLLLVPLWVARP